MQLPGYLKVLWESRRLLGLGLAVAVLAAFFAGFTIRDGGLKSRAVQSYTVATTVLATSPKDTIYQAELPSQQVRDGETPAEPVDLSSSAVLYAYIVSGSELRHQVEQQVGTLSDTESIMAVRRTTQPGGNERFPGSLKLPILDIVGVAETPERAQQISEATTTQFLDYVTKQQNQRGIADVYRVKLQVLNESKPEAGDANNVAIPMVATFFAVLLAFVALIFALHALRQRREADEQESLAGPATTPTAASDDTTVIPGSARRAAYEEDAFGRVATGQGSSAEAPRPLDEVQAR